MLLNFITTQTLTLFVQVRRSLSFCNQLIAGKKLLKLFFSFQSELKLNEAYQAANDKTHKRSNLLFKTLTGALEIGSWTLKTRTSELLLITTSGLPFFLLAFFYCFITKRRTDNCKAILEIFIGSS